MTLQNEIETILGFKLDSVDKKKLILECGADSLKLAELIGVLEQNLDIEIDFEDVFSYTIEDILKLINKK
jgi:acyl carrier protein